MPLKAAQQFQCILWYKKLNIDNLLGFSMKGREYYSKEIPRIKEKFHMLISAHLPSDCSTQTPQREKSFPELQRESRRSSGKNKTKHTWSATIMMKAIVSPISYKGKTGFLVKKMFPFKK